MRSATSGSVRKMPSMRMPPLVAMPAWWGLGVGLGVRNRVRVRVSVTVRVRVTVTVRVRVRVTVRVSVRVRVRVRVRFRLRCAPTARREARVPLCRSCAGVGVGVSG